MASSSSSNNASYTLPLSQSSFSSLPVMAMKKKIVEKIMENRVTLIVGEAGCGKSSQIPQFLLDEGMSPVLCTQPRRFAVVAVAKMVAKARNCEVGEEVGYHIGHSRHLSAGSKIVFKTAGVLLDELRDKGSAALKYKAIILDEVHERSVESDLVLVCVKQFLLKSNDLRVVLMSATADISRYRDYFKDLGRGERVEVLAIPSSNQKIVFQRHVSYLEQVAESIGISSEVMNSKYSPGVDPFTANAYIKPEFQAEFHQLIHNLVLHIHENEPDIEKSILVFLPTYYSLEQQWRLLKPLESTFKVHILHRSIDTEQALMAMKIWKSHRKVILATNIAESSVTIPKVAFVIDSCRSLQVYWDKSRRKESSKLVWVSKSQMRALEKTPRGRYEPTFYGQLIASCPLSFDASVLVLKFGNAAKRPQCKFYFSLQGCRRGESCSYSHDSGPSALSFRRDVCEPEDNNMAAASLLRFFPQATNRSILVLDDTDLHFATSLGRHYHPSKIIATTCLSETTILEQSLKGVKILWGLYHPYQTIIAKAGKNPVPWNEVQCVLWFPCFDSFGEDSDGQKQLLQNFFEYLAIRILADNLSNVKVIITINNIRFSQLKAEKLGRECFFVLTDSFAYDETSFGAILYDRLTPKTPTLVSRPTSYVFELHPPSKLLFGDYAANIRKNLYIIQEK
ncbi:hypothetical protein AHAS_Ahas12G0237700 [Arachis hypogaea]